MKKFALLFLCISISVFSIDTSNQKPFIVITVPKSGSHLLNKTLEMMTGTQANYVENISSQDVVNNKTTKFYWCHLEDFPYQSYLDNPGPWSGIEILLNTRDLRDCFVSIAHWYEINGLGRTIEDRITLCLGGTFPFFDFSFNELDLWFGIAVTTLIRFEDLVGAQGQGSDTVQYDTIEALTTTLDITMTNEEIVALQGKLFGNAQGPYSFSFVTGQIGGWNAHFTPAIKTLFKSQWNNLLIKTGYVFDDNW